MDEPEDEHARWRLYQQAAAVPSAIPELWQAIAAEPVPAVASAAVVMLLEQTHRDHRDRLVDLLDPAAREFPEKRAREIRVLESILEEYDHSDIDPEELGAWSDWLQLRVAGSTRSRQILHILAEHGRTKRIRRLARDAWSRPSGIANWNLHPYGRRPGLWSGARAVTGEEQHGDRAAW